MNQRQANHSGNRRRNTWCVTPIQARQLKAMIADGNFIAWALRERRISRSIRRGSPSAKIIGRRLKTIGMQLSER